MVRSAEALGLSAEVLLKRDQSAAECWYRKYPYFQYRKEYVSAREFSLDVGSSPEELLEDVIFNENYNPLNHRRYKHNVEKRMLALLESYRTVMPDCYHEGAKITHFSFTTNNFTHFDKIVEMTESYLDMVSRARDLFYRLWDRELSEAEKNEYNFLVTVLGMRDVGFSPSTPIYYELARKFVPVYKEERYSDYLSYIQYRGQFPDFIACKELYDHPRLILRLLEEFPRMKASMGEMAIMAKNFLCSFVWSDEPNPPIDAESDRYYGDLLQSLGQESPSWYHRIYVPKLEDELYGDEEYIGICERISAPVSQGGIPISIAECDEEEDPQISWLRRCMARIGGVPNE